MTAKQLQAYRKAMCSMQEISDMLGISKSTYQRYEDSTASVPEWVAEKVKDAHSKMIPHMKKLPRRLDKIITNQFPNGIPSERNNP